MITFFRAVIAFVALAAVAGRTDISALPDIGVIEESRYPASWNLMYGAEYADGYTVNPSDGIFETVSDKEVIFITSERLNGKCFLYTEAEDVCVSYYRDGRYIFGEIFDRATGVQLSIPEGCDRMYVSVDSGYADQSFVACSTFYNSVIFVGENEEYSSVKKACEDIEDGGAVIVLPGKYNGNIKAWGKVVYLIGTDRDECVIENHSGSYYSPPLEIAAGMVANLTINATGGPASADKPGAYGVHIEDDILYGNSLTFSNCTITSQSNSAVGMGMRGGCRIVFEDCYIKGLSDGIFFHDSAKASVTGEQNLIIRDCNILGSDKETAVHADSQGVTGATVNVTFINNRLGNKEDGSENLLYVRNNGGRGNDDNWMGLKNFYLDSESHGNNVSGLNAGQR